MKRNVTEKMIKELLGAKSFFVSDAEVSMIIDNIYIAAKRATEKAVGVFADDTERRKRKTLDAGIHAPTKSEL